MMMKTPANRVKLLKIVCLGIALLPILAGADQIYGGFSMGLLGSPTYTPFKDTTQDLDAILSANALTSPTTLTANQSALTAINTPYITNITGISSSTQIVGSNTILQNLAIQMGLSNSASIAQQATSDYAVTVPNSSSSSALLWGTAASTQSSTAIASGMTMSGQQLLLTEPALAQFSVQSCTDPKYYNTAACQQYIGLVIGDAVPPTMLTSSTFTGGNGPTNYASYMLNLAREASVQSAAVAPLLKIAEANVPLTGTPAAQLGTNFVNSGQTPTQNTITHWMATRRLNPANGWMYRIQQATPIELQRESLYMQAESLYELEQIRQQTQTADMLQAMALIEQSRSAVAMITQSAQMTSAQSASGSSSTTTSGTQQTLQAA